MKSRFARTLLLLGALLSAGVLLSVVGTRARTRPGSAQPPSAVAAHTTQRSDQQLARGLSRRAANPLPNPFDFRAASATALWSAALAPAVVTTIVNYDFNAGTSYSSLTPTLASGVLSGASSTEPFVTFTPGTATTPAAFTANATAGVALGMNNSSGANTRHFQFTLGGSSLAIYNSYKVYVQAQRSTTGAQTLTLAYSTDGTNFTNFPTTLTVPDGSFAAQVFDLSLISALNHKGFVVFRLLASGASATGTLRIDNFQVQANSVPLAGTPSVAGNKTATLATDVNGNGFVNPGDTLMYSVVVSNGGTDAMNVVFTDQLNPNLTLIGTANASPIGVNDSYGAIGNVGINVPDGVSDLLANDVDPNGNAVTISGIVGCADVTAPFVCTTANGGNITVQANGAFSYNSAPGFEGGDFFAYIVSDGQSPAKTDTANVTINVNEVIWFIDNNSANGDGRLGTPFSSIANFNSGAADDPGDIIFVYRISASDYTGSALTLLADQKLIGQGSTASLATSFTPNLTVPPFSNMLPATGGTRPTLTNNNTNVTVSTGNTIRGVNINNTNNGSALLGTSFNNLTISETTVSSSSSAAAAVNLNQGSGTAAINVNLISVSANGTANGIILQDTTGSFTVNGDGTNTSVGGNGSGGTIQNTTGADDDSPADSPGIGVRLVNAQNVTLRRITLTTHSNFAIYGESVNGFTFEYATVNGTNGTDSPMSGINNPTNSDASVLFNNLTGAALFKDSLIEGALEDNVRVINTGSSVLNRIVFNNVTIGLMDLGNARGDNGILLQARNTSTMNVTIQDSDFTHARGDIFQLDLTDTATSDLIFDNNTVNNQHPFVGVGGGGITISGGGSATANPTLTYEFDNNSFRGARGTALLIIFQTGSGSASGRIEGNTFGVSGIDQSGTREAANIEVRTEGRAAQTVLINNNQIRQYGQHGIYIEFDGINTAGSMGTIGGLNATITNNTIEQPASTAGNKIGLHLNFGASTGDNYQGCVDILNNTAPNAGSPDTGAANRDYVLRQRALTTVRLPGYMGANNDDAAVQTYIQNRNTGTETVFASNTVSTGGGGFIGGATCTQPPAFAPPAGGEGNNDAKQSSADTAQLLEQLTGVKPLWLSYLNPTGQRLTNGSGAARLMKSEPLRPTLAAFTTPLSHVKLGRLFDKAVEVIAPTAVAAESKPSVAATAPAVPARTMLVNSRGEYRIVPTAALAGELITINGTGSGFLLPAGESTTVMFNAQISAAFTGTAITNQASVSGTGFGPVLSNNLSTDVIQAPTISKAFNPVNIATNTGVSTLTFTLTNPNPNQALSGIAFSDVFPAGLSVAATPALSNGCGGTFTPAIASGQTSVSYSGGTLGAGAGTTCTISFNVRGTTDGAKPNTTSTITATQTNTGATSNTATLNVINAPTFSKAFTPAAIPLNGTSTLSFTITNNSPNFMLTGVGFTDTLPAGVQVAATPNITGSCGGGTITATAGAGTISLSGATLSASGSCTFSVAVTGTTTGNKSNTVNLATTELGATSATATAMLEVIGPPTVTKSFMTSPIALGASTTMSFLLTNPNATTTLTGIGFSDTLPSGITVVSATSPQCGGTVTTTSSSVTFSGGTLAGGATCTVNVTVMGAQAGSWPNTATNVTSTEGGAGVNSNTATIVVVGPPVISKAFGAASIALNGTTSLTFTIQNPAANTVGLTGIAFTDTLPAGLVVATPNGLSGMCGGTVTAVAGSGSISLTGGSLAVGGSCMITVNVTGTTGGVKNNVSGNVTSTNGGTGNTAMASLTVASAPTISKAFGAATIPLNGSTSLSFTINNPNAGVGLTGVSFTDSLPAGLVVATPNGLTGSCGSGTITAVAGSGSISLSGGTIAAGGMCTFAVNVTGTTTGAKNNTTGAISSTETGAGAVSNTATVTVVAPPTISKAFGAATIPLNGTTSLTFTINNPSTVTQNGIAFSDTLPAGLVVATPNGLSGMCGGTVTAVAGSNSISLSGGTLTGSGMCTIAVNVTGTAAGVQNNTTSTISSTEGGTGATSNTASVTVVAPPTISKAFGAPNIALNGSTSLTFTINNPNSGVGLTGIAFTDNLPSGLVVATPNGLSGMCGGTVTAVAGSGSISLTGGTLAASGSCMITVNVTGTTTGSKNNTTNAITSTNGGTGATSNTATLIVGSPPTVSKAFGAATVPVGGTTSLSFTVTNTDSSQTLTGIGFTDTLPAGLVVATPNGQTGSCGGGTITAVDGSGSITLSGASLAPSGTCTFAVNVTGTTAGVKNNTTGQITSTETGPGGTSNTATLTVVAPPNLSKVFTPASIPLGTTTSLDFTITNPNTTVGLSGISFTDVLPAGLTVADGSTSPCGGTLTVTAATRTISFSGGTLTSGAPGNTCTFSVTVTGATAGGYTNTIDSISSTNGGTNGTDVNASLSVVAPPMIAKAFGAPSVALNGTTSLTFTITNPAANTVGLTGVSFTDTLPAGLVVATPNGLTGMCGGTVTAVAGSGSISLTGGSIAASGSCMIVVNVTGTTVGVKNNSVTVNSTNGGTGNTSMASLSVGAAPTISKAFGASSIQLNGSTSLTLTINNPNASLALTGISFTDSLPAGLVVATPNGLSGACGGTVTAVAGSGSVSLTGGSLAASGSCMITLNVTGTTAGDKNNTTGAISSNESGAGATSNTATVTVVGPPTISKAFGAATIPLNGTTSLTFTINNPSTVAQSGVAFTDNLPAGLVVATPNGLSGMCGGTVTAVAGSGSISLSGGTLAGSGSCMIAVNVTGTTAGVKNNTTGAISSTTGGTGATSNTASVAVFAPPTISKAFAPTAIPLNGTSTLTITITNPAGNPGALNGLGVTDLFPNDVVVANPLTTNNTCNGALQDGTGGALAPGDNGIRLVGGSIATAGNSCSFSVNVTAPTAGAKVNTTGNVTSTEGGAGLTATATLSVGSQPGFTKTFVPAEVKLNELATLTFNLTNPNGFQITGVAFSDTLPSDLVLDTNPMASNTCNGTLTATGNTNVISLTGGSINANGACQISVKVKAPTPGAKNNVSGAISTNQTGTGGTASATLAVVAPPQISKAFSPGSILTGGTSTLTFTITNPSANTVALTGVAFTDNLPAGLVVATPNNLGNNCSGGTASAVPGSGVISLTGASIPAGGSCMVVANVTATSAGGKNNVSGNVTSTNGGTGNTASATLNVSCPAITVNPATVPNGGVGVPYPATNFSASGGAPSYTFSVSSGTLPNGLSLTGATLAGTPTEGGSFSFTIRATDANQCTGTRDYTLVINRPPVLAPIGNKAIAPNQTLTFTAMATDPDPGDTLTFSLTGAPAGATINPTTGQFSWTPTAAQTGMHTFTVVVTDNGNPPLADSEQITVTVGNLTPTISLVVSFLNTNPTNVGLAAQLLDSFTNAPIPGKTITFQIGNQTTTGVTDNNGNATGTIQVAAPGTYAAKATFAGDASFPMAMTVTSFNVTVGGQSCTFTITPTSQSFASNGGTGTVQLTTPASNCNWSAASSVPWITLTGGLGGTGNGTVSYTVAPNSGSTVRSGTINIAGLSFTVVQSFQFLDVPPSHIFYTEIGKLAARGVTLGCGGGNYCPDDVVSRQQMAAFIIRALHEPGYVPPTPAMQRFADVPPSNIFYAHIEEMALRQITLGCGGGNYCPTNNVTREAMAAFIIRALHPPGYVPPTPASQRFADVPPSNPFYAHIEELAVRGITLGCGGGNYCPTQNVLRSQMAAFLVRAFGL